MASAEGTIAAIAKGDDVDTAQGEQKTVLNSREGTEHQDAGGNAMFFVWDALDSAMGHGRPAAPRGLDSPPLLDFGLRQPSSRGGPTCLLNAARCCQMLPDTPSSTHIFVLVLDFPRYS